MLWTRRSDLRQQHLRPMVLRSTNTKSLQLQRLVVHMTMCSNDDGPAAGTLWQHCGAPFTLELCPSVANPYNASISMSMRTMIPVSDFNGASAPTQASLLKACYALRCAPDHQMLDKCVNACFSPL